MFRRKSSYFTFRKIVTYICLASIFMEYIPVSAISNGDYEMELSDMITTNGNEENNNYQESEEVNTDEENNDSELSEELNETENNSTSEESENLNDNKENSDSEGANDDKESKDENIGNTEDEVNNIINAYTAEEDEVAFSISFNRKENKFVVKEQSTKQLSKEELNSVIYKINVYDKKSTKKLNIELLGSDTGNTEKLKVLSEAKYEIGDFIEIIPSDPKNGLKILGDIEGAIDKAKEDYSDGIDNPDYINNVRFEITEKGIKSIYNEAPVISGLSDVKDIKDKNINPLEGIVVTDDHDGTIDNSKVLVEVEEKSESDAVLKYTVQDSWGRSTSGTRKFYGVEKVKETEKTEKNEEPKKEESISAYSANQSSLIANEITVEGVPYFGDYVERFKIQFNPVSKEIKIVDDDGRMLNNLETGEYFKFELYSKDMELKSSVTLLGTDKSDSEKLDAINNKIFEEGDYIGIWHAESDTKLKIAGHIQRTNKVNGQAVANGSTISYATGIPQAEISERRFRITKSGLELIENDAPVISELSEIYVNRGQEVDLLTDLNGKVTDDFDKFDDESIENEEVFITHTPFDKSKVGKQIITYTATDKWGRTGSKNRTVNVTSTNPLEYTSIEFMKNSDESLFKIKIDPVTNQLFVDDLESIQDDPIDEDKRSSVFKLKIYTQGGVLQKTLNIRGNDNLKSVLRKINGYKYAVNDRIELWSSTPNNVRIHGELLDNNGDEKEDYSNGIDNIDYMNNVRFEIGQTNLKYIYNKAPEFKITEELTVNRNGEVNLMQGITATDDYDKDIEGKIVAGSLDTSTIGEKYVEYKVVDSWGRSTVIKRKVTVYPYTDLEYNYITIKNYETNKPIISIKFDDNLKRFNINNIDLSNIPSYIENNQEVFRLTIFRNNNNSKTANGEIKSFTKADLANQSKLDEIKDISYEYGDYISLNVYDSLNGIVISGKSYVVLNGFDNADQMVNSRFKIEGTGLKLLYNESPVFSGLENTLYLFKGQELGEEYAKQGITANDDIDGEIQSDQIHITNLGSISTDELGDYKLEYTVTDAWGRTTSKERTVSVISKSVSNEIEFYDETSRNKLFSLRYNPIKNGFDVTRNEQSSGSRKRTSEDTTTPQPEEENKVFKLGVYDSQGNEEGKLELSEEDITNPDSNAFDKLEDIPVYNDYYFSVWSTESLRIRIQGDMTGNSNLGEDDNQEENYSDGINENDYMINVRFKLRVDGLKAVYNKAPKINIPLDKLTAFAGDPIDYLKGVTVLDDHDESIPKENIRVDKVENDEENNLVIGENIVNLTVTDSWGREGTAIRNLSIENGIAKNTIRFVRDRNNTNSKVLDIGFDYNTMKLKLTTYNNNETFGPGKEGKYVRIRIVRPGENGSGDTEIVPWIYFSSNERPENNRKLDRLQNYNFEYGDYFEFYHGHPLLFSIDGKVNGSREDYTDGVQNPENILNIKFQITKSGLKTIYTNPDENNVADNKNIIGPMAPEKFPFKLQVIPNERKFRVIEETGTDILSGDRSVVYKLVLIGSDGRIKLQTNFNGNDRGNQSPKVDEWNDLTFEYNDALYIWHKEPSRSIIKGNIIGEREDYSNGVDDDDNMNNVVFKLTANGLESVYNEAPEIIGADDKDVYKGSNFNAEEGVTYRDDYDHYDRNQITVDIDNEVNTDTLGEQYVTYTATDRWNNTTTIRRKITVRPELYKNIFKVFSDTDSGEDSDINSPKVAFEIGFDTVTNKYRVFNQGSERLSPNNPTDVVFSIEIKASNGDVKSKIDLLGNDRGDSPKLNELKELRYDNGDIIRVYRNSLDCISFEGPLTGDVPNEGEIDSDENKRDYMVNTGFIVSEDGLKAKYNKAPNLIGVDNSRTITKGTTLDLLENVIVSDEIDNDITNNSIIISIDGKVIANKNDYTFDKLGTYTVQYTIQDSWGRTVTQISTILVESKVKENSIEVYAPDRTLAFKVKFDVEDNIFVLEGPNGSSTYNTSQEENKYFEMVVRDIKGKEKYTITLNGNLEHDRSELDEIHNQSFSKYDTISLYSKYADAVKIQGEVKNKSFDYTTGFGDTDKYSNVRFKITDDGLTEIINKGLKISGVKNKTIKRGDDFDFKEGVVVDVGDTNNEDYDININSDGFNQLKEGGYDVTYTITNSWGTTVKKTRRITVEPRNELEEVKLTLKNTSDQDILTIGFDSIQKKFRVLSHRENSSIDSNDSNIVFILNVYDSLGKTVGNLELTGSKIIDEEILNRINNVSYLEEYSISVWAKNPETHLELEGDIQVGEKYKRRLSPIDKIDKMENGRFEILTNGLKYIYNNAPKIIGEEQVIDYYKGSILSVPSNIRVEDDHDDISIYEVSIDDDQVDYDVLGEHEITYKVEDSWGRIGEKTGRINIKSAMDSNVIEIYPISNAGNQSSNKAFSIKFVRENNENKIIVENKSSEPLNSNKPNEIFMRIKIYNSTGQEIKKVELLGNDSGQSANFDEINNYVYNRGEYISIEGVTEETKSSIRIHGTVVNKKEDYDNGVNVLDNIQNVRFKFTDLGLESVYNKEPRIVINNTVILVGVKGDDIPYMRGVKLLDDHDNLTKDNVEVSWNQNSKTIKGEPIVGENTLHYKVTDSWGRSSYETRNVTLANGILDNEIRFNGDSVEDILKIKFNHISDTHVSISLEGKDNRFLDGRNEKNYYQIKLYETDETIPSTIVQLDGHDWGTSDKLNRIKNKEIPYGTKIEFYAGHPDRLKIDGPVRNQREDYSDGVQNPENYSSVKFEVTDSGLRSIYTESDTINDNENIIALVAKEKLPIKFKIDPLTKKINIYDSNPTGLQWELGSGIQVFRMTLSSSDGIVKNTVTGESRDLGNSSKFNEFNDLSYDFGDYLTIWHKTPKRIIIKGKVKNNKEDYSDGVDNSDNLVEAVFKLTPEGIEAAYKSAPKIRGAKDDRILKGGELNLQYIAGEVRAYDEIDGEITRDIVMNKDNVNTNKVGLYEVTYEVTNSNQRTARKSSTIQVYANPEIVPNNKRVIELNGIPNNDSEIKEYLKTAVNVTDEEDTANGRDIKLEVVNHTVKPNEEGTYTATYRATDSEGGVTEKTIDIDVVRTINVSVPTTIPFQVVTNLIDKEADPFVSGIIKLQNNNTSNVTVSVQSFNKKEGSGDLQIVDPTNVNWDNLSVDESMNKMSLGLYHKKGLNLADGIKLTKEEPLWLKESIQETELGVLNRAGSLSNPYEVQLSFISKHGKKFKGGNTKGKFELVFKFE